MPDNSTMDNAETATPAAVEETTVVEETRKPFYTRPKFILGLVGLLVLVGAVLFLINVFNVYQKATTYKKGYDIVKQEQDRCAKIQGTTQTKEDFDYCDKFTTTFKDVP